MVDNPKSKSLDVRLKRGDHTKDHHEAYEHENASLPIQSFFVYKRPRRRVRRYQKGTPNGRRLVAASQDGKLMLTLSLSDVNHLMKEHKESEEFDVPSASCFETPCRTGHTKEIHGPMAFDDEDIDIDEGAVTLVCKRSEPGSTLSSFTEREITTDFDRGEKKYHSAITGTPYGSTARAANTAPRMKSTSDVGTQTFNLDNNVGTQTSCFQSQVANLDVSNDSISWPGASSKGKSVKLKEKPRKKIFAKTIALFSLKHSSTPKESSTPRR